MVVRPHIFLKFLISLNFQIHSFALYVLYKYSSPILCVQTIFLVFLTVGAFLAFLSDATLSPQCDLRYQGIEFFEAIAQMEQSDINQPKVCRSNPL